MGVKNSGDMLLQLRALLNAGAIGSLSDGQLLERFAEGRGEPRELAFAALVARHGPFVLRVCRSVLRDEAATEDAFQATFLALARKAGSLRVRDSLAPWLHQAAYRAAIHDRSMTIRRRSHEFAAAALRAASSASAPQPRDDLEAIIHEELDRLPGRFRAALVLCDLEGRTHEQAAQDLGCAVGTVKSRLARGRQRLRGRLERRGLAPGLTLLAVSSGGVARAAVPTALAESTVAYATAAGVVPRSIIVITEGVLISMLLRKIKLAATAAGVVAVIAAGAVALAQPGTVPKDPGGEAKGVDTSNWTYHILVSRKDEPPRKVAVVEMIGDTPIRVEAPGASILISPRGDEERRTGDGEKKDGTLRVDGVRARRKIILTNPRVMDADVVQQYVAQIHARRHINIRALENGFIRKIEVKEGQAVKVGALMIEISPHGDKPRPAGYSGRIVAPFDGLVGSLNEQVGALVKEGENLTELSDNSEIWVYFKMPERQYLDYMAEREKREGDRVELVLANGARFSQTGKIGAIEANFDASTGAIAFRADFPNPDRVLRHGQTGTVLIHHKIPDAVVIPQRATFEILDKRYVYVVDKDEVTHQREITVSNELDDLFVIKKGVGVGDRIVLDGIREVRDGEKEGTDLRPAKKK